MLSLKEQLKNLQTISQQKNLSAEVKQILNKEIQRLEQELVQQEKNLNE